MSNSTSWRFYHDAALTQEITLGNPLSASQGGGLGPVDKTIYLGSTASSMKLQAQSNPGVAAVVLTIVDANAGTGAPATEFRLSLSPITGAETPGASLTLPVTLTSGVSNRVTIYTRRTSALVVAGAYSDLTPSTNAVVEAPV